MRALNWSVVIGFEDGESSDRGTGEALLVVVMGLRVGALLDLWCRVEWSKSSAGVGESAGEDKKVRPELVYWVEKCWSLVSGKISCTDRRFGTFADATGLPRSQP
jgi:hypothetical protein